MKVVNGNEGHAMCGLSDTRQLYEVAWHRPDRSRCPMARSPSSRRDCRVYTPPPTLRLSSNELVHVRDFRLLRCNDAHDRVAISYSARPRRGAASLPPREALDVRI
jgi:hypothetical protein